MTSADWQNDLRIASGLRRSGRVAEAIDAYKRLLAMKPDLPESWYNLGLLQKQTRAFEEALESYARALALQVSAPEEVRLNRAVILSDHLHRSAEAERELRAALAANERYVPALLNLGNLMEDIGEREDARGAYERALKLEPGNRLALARLASISVSTTLDAELASRLRRAIADRAAPLGEQADLGFALAAMLDAAQHHDEAFDAAIRANDASRRAAGAAARYDGEAHETHVEAIVRTFNRASAVATLGEAPVFICGMFRSGSTLVEQILGRHSHIHAAGELDLIPALVASISGYPQSVGVPTRDEVERWRATYLGGLPERSVARQLVTDKRPDNFLHIGLIKTLFPAAKIIHTRRNPLDNLLSLYFLHLDPAMAYALDLRDAAHWYRQYAGLMEHWRTLYPNDIFDVDYDELVQAPRALIEELLQFLGLSWKDELLDFHQGRTAVKTASVWQVREPLHSRSSGRWRNYERQLAPLKSLLDLD